MRSGADRVNVPAASENVRTTREFLLLSWRTGNSVAATHNHFDVLRECSTSRPR